MAKLVETALVIKVSKLAKDSETVEELVSAELLDQLEAVLEELIGDDRAMVEVIKTEE